MRLVRTLTVLALVILLPAISWYYLSKGADWRKRGLAEISQRTQIDFPSLLTSEGTSLGQDDLFGSFAIAVDGATVPVPDLQKLTEQFGVRQDMQFLMFNGQAPDTEDDPWVHIDCVDTACRMLTDVLFPGTKNAALIDDSLQVRRSYDLREAEEMKRLIEHGAILLPTEKREQIELIRGE
ncbi:MAG: hypothetical protein R3330_07585 [Saprospiraceae bacterium]|nr:hypothetical protein [Saprospiraceae bacterium]